MAEVPREFKAQLYRNQVRSFSTLTGLTCSQHPTLSHGMMSHWQWHSMSRSILMLLQTGDAPHLHQDQLPAAPAQWLSDRARILPILGPSSQWVTSEFGKLGLACVL